MGPFQQMPNSGTICYVFIVPDNVCKKRANPAFLSHVLHFYMENVRNKTETYEWRRNHVRNTGSRSVYRRVSGEDQKGKRCKRDDVGELSNESGVSFSAVSRLYAGTQADPRLYNSAALCKTLGLSLDELFGLENPVGSPEKLTKQIHHVELENAKLEATAAAQSAQIKSTHTMCYVLALFCMLLSFSLIACLVADAQIRNAGFIRNGDLSVTAWACIALIVGSALASAITFYAIRKERGGKHGVHQV